MRKNLTTLASSFALAGVLLSITGYYDHFRRFNPELFKAFSFTDPKDAVRETTAGGPLQRPHSSGHFLLHSFYRTNAGVAEASR